jgi:hypothetical protein
MTYEKISVFKFEALNQTDTFLVIYVLHKWQLITVVKNNFVAAQ